MSLRDGISCSIPLLNYDTMTRMMGGMNCHIPLNFDDGVTWICRIRRNNVSSPPPELQNLIILSEAATLCFLVNTKVPVPRVHDFAVMTSTNPVGVGYIVMDKLEGQPLPNWNDIPVDRMEHILEQFVEVFVELEKSPFLTIGSLQNPGNLSIGPIAAEQFADLDENNNLQLLGPFKNAVDYRLATVRQQMEFIARGEVHHTNAIDSYLVHGYLLEHAPAFSRREQCSASMYYLKHMDDKGDHILVDDDYNITGIIDWEWAQTMPKGEAFTAPMFLLDVGAYYDGKNALSEGEELFASVLAEKGHEELASIVRSGRRQHRWASCLGGDAGDRDSLCAMFMGLRAELCCDQEGWDAWRKQALVNYKNDEGLIKLLKKYPGTD
jgi:hypothetical protein